MNIQWNAEDYKSGFSFVPQYGEDVMELIPWRPGLKILDVGCGNGTLTSRLKERGAEVCGIDASPQMLEIARRDYPDIPFYQKDASSFAMEEPYDIVFSNAVFHWIDDQDGLLSSIAGVLKPGGTLVCEFGGFGCCESIHHALEEAFQARGLSYPRTFYFPTIGQYAPLLERHGLRPDHAILFDRKTRLTGEDGMTDWINMFNRSPFADMDEDTAAAIKAEAVQALRPVLWEDGIWYADYVRIRIRAVRTEQGQEV